MSGHSKFKNIMHKKSATDKIKSKTYGRIARELTTAVKMGGNNFDTNPRLRLALETARKNSVPKINIERAINKGMSDDTANYVEITYEARLPHNIALIIEASTDNKNRAASEIRSTLTKMGGSLSVSGSVSFDFDLLGQLVYSADDISEDAFFEFALKLGASDITSNANIHTLYVNKTSFAKTLTAAEKEEIKPMESALIWKAKNLINLQGEDREKIQKAIDTLENLEDVSEIFSNLLEK